MTVATSQSTAINASTRAELAHGDFYTVQHGRTWTQFKHLQKGYENSNVRLSFYRGTVGILMPSREHEIFKSIIGFLIELFLFHKRIEFVATGSTTRECEETASAEPDESYEIEDFKLAIEINFTSGDLSKLERYKALGFNEVWVWEDGVLEIYQLQGDRHQQIHQSSIPALSSLDLKTMSECILMGETSRLAASDKLIEIHFNQ